ncbi:MAG: cytochrome P450 [Advenella sp.]|uniref:cytochrome P450 n=1 Tax=Advenella sp. TaxID=1872388 RepID=UPI00258ADCFB|nr:cytochrome P450 [Advenella sp.]MDD3758977.1 cytochrome P450 [Advenella sp.]
MNDTPTLSNAVQQASVSKDPITAYDQIRQRCPVVHDERLHWTLFKHEDVMNVLNDPQTFSNAVSRHVSVPNGMDQPEHTIYRALIEPFFNESRMAAFEPVCQEIAAELVRQSHQNQEFEFISGFAQIYAVRAQCAFLGWPESLHEPLNQWVRKNHQATLAQDRQALSEIAVEFDGYIRTLLEERRKAGIHAPDDLTTALMRETVNGQPISDEAIVSILRNWTVGELGSIAACLGILVNYLGKNLKLQHQLRYKPKLLPAAIDEILRIPPPLIASRRVTTQAVTVAGHHIEAGERLTLLWASANRDEAVFGKPDEFRNDREPSQNLLYGAGIHACPGAPLARLELRLIMQELLKGTSRFALGENAAPVHAVYPAGGFDSLPIKLVMETCCGACS